MLGVNPCNPRSSFWRLFRCLWLWPSALEESHCVVEPLTQWHWNPVLWHFLYLCIAAASIALKLRGPSERLKRRYRGKRCFWFIKFFFRHLIIRRWFRLFCLTGTLCVARPFCIIALMLTRFSFFFALSFFFLLISSPAHFQAFPSFRLRCLSTTRNFSLFSEYYRIILCMFL